MAQGAHEVELGEVVEVERRPRAGVVLSVRLSVEEAEQLHEIAKRRGATVSRIGREALVAFCSLWRSAALAASVLDGNFRVRGQP